MSRTEQAVAADLAEWGSPAPRGWRSIDVLWLGLVLGVPTLLVALLLALFLNLAAAAVAVVLIAIGLAVWIGAQPRSVLRSVEARPLKEGEAPRFSNVARGRSADLGMDCPSLWVIENEGSNAVVGRSGAPALAVARKLLDTYTRTELEALVTHCLLRLDPAFLRRASFSKALGEVAGPAGALDLEGVDSSTVALTRYPPALAGAVEKAEPKGGRGAAFWFVPGEPRLSAPEARVALLRDL